MGRRKGASKTNLWRLIRQRRQKKIPLTMLDASLPRIQTALLGNRSMKSKVYGCAETFSPLTNNLPSRISLLIICGNAEGWFLEAPNNQAMRFGDLPSWAIELSNSIREVILYGDRIHEPPNCAGSDRGEAACWLPPDLLSREPFFDQLIANVYQPGEGICAHVDLMRFEDGIAIVSLESSCVMHFTQVGEVSGSGKEQPDLPMIKIPVFLMPGSLVLLFGDARYLWKHEINRKPGFQMWEGQEVNQKRRTSITLRKLCHAE
ncbi:ALKYLATED DNA REPAIR PROTEIN ALKB-like protein 8 ISOFORM X1 [Salix koriyanagi]|uniref:ALKYLATED DNA REPAIR PROTEIN ALKB-like protein 8 ISOFORM X1 n=1 Tax=Salix koriyanagi TaxID=2511006 RepID=A0A9Q0U4R2_9ROSI|nr:ALKYLATED DNA REPAIR PROTEIN ALKB-like protein 8 ISOFORM X1 [Salix koriyanagi]